MAVKRGGFRIGAGKKRVFENPVNVNSRLEESELELIKVSRRFFCVSAPNLHFS